MSDMANEIGDEFDVVDDFNAAAELDEYEPSGEPKQPWVVPQEQWQQLSETVGYLANAVRLSHAEGLAERQAQQQSELEDLAYEDPERYAQELFAREVAPLKAYIEQHQEAGRLDEAQDLADDILLEAGVPEEELDSIQEVAIELLEPMMQAYGEQYNHLYENVLREQGPEAAERWVDEARQKIAVAALKQAASSVQLEQQSAGGDEMSVVEKYSKLLGMSRGGAPRQSVASRSGGDEMSVVAKWAGRAR